MLGPNGRTLKIIRLYAFIYVMFCRKFPAIFAEDLSKFLARENVEKLRQQSRSTRADFHFFPNSDKDIIEIDLLQ